MEAALVWYILLNLALFGFVLFFVRAARGHATPDERQDLEENALVTADWDLVRRERCLPNRCPRAMGQPPRPRKDVTCEVCAATFLEVRLQRLLDSPPAPDPGRPDAPNGAVPEGLIRSPHTAGPSLHPRVTRRQEPLELDLGLPDAARGRRGPGAFGRRRLAPLVRLFAGIGSVVAGAAVAAFGGMLWLILPGYLLVLVGLGLIAWGALSGAL